MMVEPVVEDLSPASLAAANEANYSGYYAFRTGREGAANFDEADLVMRVTSSPAPILNFAARARLSPDKVDACVAKVVACFKEKGVPGFWYVGPLTQPPEIGKVLKKYGFARIENRPGMGIDLSAMKNSPLPRGLAIEPVERAQQLQAWADVILVGFEVPVPFRDEMIERTQELGFGPDLPAQNYLGTLNGRPVAVSTVYYGAGVTGIYSVATLPEARGKGIGTAMTLKPLLEARQRGYRAAILQSSEMGLSVYEKIGFRENCRIDVYLWKPG
jgi:ribosomal protein S18 acetylase RimI-like enzyme